MAKKNNEETEFNLDMEDIKDAQLTIQHTAVLYEDTKPQQVRKAVRLKDDDEELVNCLRKEVITVKHLPQPGTINDPKHVLYGGMAETATVTFTVPRLRSGIFVDILTKSEKKYLEYIMGLEDGAMNVYNKHDNFWDNSSKDGISKVRLSKQDTKLHLDNPIEYIYYKILLANKDRICPDPLTLSDKPKATYQFLLISDENVSNIAKSKMDTKKKCWMEYGKIETNEDVLRAIIETITAKTLSKNTKLDFLQTRAGELMDADPKLFLSIILDPLLHARILIKKCVEHSFISRKGDWYYLRNDGSPLCEAGEEPTLKNAARYLSDPKRLDLKFSLEVQLKQ